MASDKDFVEFVVDQIRNAGEISYRKMFGEYAVYCDGKVVALICDNHLFIKPTESGRAFVGNVVEAPPYPGAKLHFLIEDQFEDSEWISELVRITVDELPPQASQGKKEGYRLKEIQQLLFKNLWIHLSVKQGGVHCSNQGDWNWGACR